MGRRHKRDRTAEADELWRASLLARGNTDGMKKVSLPDDYFRMDPVLPPGLEANLSYRQVGYFRGKKIFETGLSVSYLQ